MQQLEERNTCTPTDIPHIRGNCGLPLNREETLSVSDLKTSSNISDAALTASLIRRTELVSFCHSYQKATESGTRLPIRYSATNDTERRGTLLHTLKSVVSATPAPHEEYEIPDVRAAIIVHTFGNPCCKSTIEKLKSKGIIVIEDCAEAMGASWGEQKVGTKGNAAIFSFTPTKIMTTGEGGMIVTNNDILASYIKLLSSHGIIYNGYERIAIHPGHNYRMSNILAAIGRVQLSMVDTFCESRRNHAIKMNQLLEGLPLDLPEIRYKNVFQIYTIAMHEGIDRDRAISHLRNHGIDAKVYFNPPIHKQSWYLRNYPGIKLENTEDIAARVISLPMYPDLTTDEMEYMSSVIREALCS